MAKKTLTLEAAMEIKRLYELRDACGNRLYSQLQVGDIVGVSETTVFRTVRQKAKCMEVSNG